MGFRFRQVLRILPGIRLNLSKSGVSTSLGVRGATINVNSKGWRPTVGLPGSGLSYVGKRRPLLKRAEAPRSDAEAFQPFDAARREDSGEPLSAEDELFVQRYAAAIRLTVESAKASTSWLQRRLKIGYNEAAWLIVQMERDGIVSAPDALGRREVLLTPEDLENADADDSLHGEA